LIERTAQLEAEIDARETEVKLVNAAGVHGWMLIGDDSHTAADVLAVVRRRAVEEDSKTTVRLVAQDTDLLQSVAEVYLCYLIGRGLIRQVGRQFVPVSDALCSMPTPEVRVCESESEISSEPSRASTSSR